MNRFRTLIWILVYLSAGADAVESDRSVIASVPYQAGRVVLWTKHGFTPTIPALMPEMAFAQLKSFDGWHVRPLMPPVVNATDRPSGCNAASETDTPPPRL